MSLTKRKIDSLAPTEKEFVVWDDKPKGLGLRVWPSGKKTFVLKYRTHAGRQRKASLGVYGPLTLDDARKKAKRFLADVSDGKDPGAEKAEARKAANFREFAERYIREYAIPRKAPSSVVGDKRMLRLRLLPTFGHMRLTAITRADIANFHSSISDTPYMANRYVALLSKMMNLAEEWGLRPEHSNPCRHITKYKEQKRERFLTDEEIARLWVTLDECEGEGLETDMACAAIRLLLLTGCRMNEILTLKWEYLDKGYLVLPQTKTGPQRRAISQNAQDVLAGIPREADNPYVIRGKIPGTHLVEVKKAWQRIRTRADLEGVRLHDLRHTFASVAASAGMPLKLIGELLGHRDIQTTNRYAHLADAAVQAAAHKVGATLDQAISSGTGYSNP